MKNVRIGAWLLLCTLLFSVPFAKAEGNTSKPLYPAIQGNLWGYIDADNQWVVPPYNSWQPDYAYDNDFFYDDDSEEWLDAQGDCYPMDEIVDPTSWGLTELNGHEVYWCKGQRFGQGWLVRCHAEGEEYTTVAWVQLDNNLNRLNDLVYFDVLLSEDDSTLIALLEKDAATGSLMDDQGRVLREGLPFGKLSEDGLVITNYRGRDNLYFDAQTGAPLDEQQVAVLHAAHCPEGLWPYRVVEPQEKVEAETETTDWSWTFPASKEAVSYIVYVDGEGNVAEHLGRFRYASQFRQGLATVETEDGQQKIIDPAGNTVLADVRAVNHTLYGTPQMQDGWVQVDLCAPDRLAFAGCNYLNAQGELLFPDCNLRRSEPFFEGRALVQVMLPDYSIAYAHIDPTGKIIWVEDGVDASVLQSLLDQGSCPSPADLTAEDVTNMLVGEWSCTGGGELLTEVQHEDGSWSAALTPDGTWYVRETKPGERFYRDDHFVFVEVYTDADGHEQTSEVGLEIYHRDAFGVSWGEGGSGYARYQSRFDERWAYKQKQEQRSERQE